MLRKDSCNCDSNTKFGTWEQCVPLNPPSWSSKELIWIDKCLMEEIKYLWSLGIVTGGCCCGHKQNLPFINVYPKSIDKMIEMGYIMQSNPHVPSDGSKRIDTFYPKSITIEPQMIESFIQHYYNVGLIKLKEGD